MPTVNNNQPVDMKQLWQQMEPAPVASSATSALTTAEDGSSRFLYYIVGATFFRYDTYGNSWQKLASPPATPTTFASLRFTKFGGTRGRVQSCPSSATLQIGVPSKGAFLGKTITIWAGKGAGQTRTITACADIVKHDHGVPTTASVNAITDSTKKWRVNQWAGYNCRITTGAGNAQVRKILYNNATDLFFFDNGLQPHEPWNNTGFAAAPVATAGAQSHFVIESAVITVNQAWDDTPDYTSRYMIDTGGLWLFSSASSTPFYQLAYYDIAYDMWLGKTCAAGIITSNWATCGSMERTGLITGVLATGTASSGGSYTLADSGQAWLVDQWKNYRVRITAGTGVGQSKRIICNTATTLEVTSAWYTTPDATSVYEITPEQERIYLAGNAASSMYQYDVDVDLPCLGSRRDYGIAANMSCRYSGPKQRNLGVASALRSTGGILAVNATPSAAGAGYVAGDLLTVSTGGTNGKVSVEAVNTSGGVTAIAIAACGAGYSTGAAKATTGGTGSGCTIEITTIGDVGRITVATPHYYRIGEQITFKGASEAAWNTTYTILGCDATNVVDVAISATTNASAANSQAATTLVDASKSWAANEHVGKLLQLHLVGYNGAVTGRYITANTATTLTFASATAPVNGTGRYVITDVNCFGRDEQVRVSGQGSEGHATGGSNTTLVDTTKNWKVNQWAGYKVRIQAGTGRDTLITITSNTATTLNYADAGFTPDATTHYLIWDSFGLCTATGTTTTLVDTTKNWAVNQWAGKRVRLTTGAGSQAEVSITSNTATVLTLAVTITIPDNTTAYTILGLAPRLAGSELVWLYGQNNGRSLLSARGGGAVSYDLYDITTEKWEYCPLAAPQTDTFSTGTYWAYDAESGKVYLSPNAATGAVQYVYELDVDKMELKGFGSAPNTQGSAVLGNRMEIVRSPAGIKYLYHMRQSYPEMYRAQLFF